MNLRSKSGLLIFIGAVQFLILMIIAETQYPGYSPSENYISDLGLWEYDSAYIFNPSVSLFGALGICGSYLLLKSSDRKTFPVLLMLSGAGAVGVGIFNEDVEGVHFIVSAIAFGFAGLAAISSIQVFPRTIGAAGMVLGTISLVAMALYVSDTYLGLGPGGMERMIFYPVMGWVLAMSGHLMSAEISTKEK